MQQQHQQHVSMPSKRASLTSQTGAAGGMSPKHNYFGGGSGGGVQPSAASSPVFPSIGAGRRMSMASGPSSGTAARFAAKRTIRHRLNAGFRAVLFAVTCLRLVRGPAALTPAERRAGIALFESVSPITTFRQLAHFARRAGMSVVSEQEAAAALRPALQRFDGLGCPLTLHEARRVLSFIKRQQYRTYVMHLRTGEIGDVLSALRLMAETSAPADGPSKTPAADINSNAGSGAASPSTDAIQQPSSADASDDDGSVDGARETSRRRRGRGGPSTSTFALSSLRRVLASTLGIQADASSDLLLPAGASDREVTDADIDALLRAGDSAVGGKRRRRRGSNPMQSLLGIRLEDQPHHGGIGAGAANMPGGGVQGGEGTDNRLRSPDAGDGAGLNGTTILSPSLGMTMDELSPTVAFEASAKGRSGGAAGFHASFSGNLSDDETELARRARQLRHEVNTMELPPESVVRHSQRSLMLTRDERGGSSMKQRLFPKLHHRATTYTLDEFDQIVQREEAKAAAIAYSPKRQPNCTVAFSGAQPLPRFTSVEKTYSSEENNKLSTDAATLKLLRFLQQQESHNRSPSPVVPGLSPSASAAAAAMSSSTFSGVAAASSNPVANNNAMPLTLSREDRRRVAEYQAEQQRQLTERLMLRRETGLSRELPKWKQAWKRPPVHARLPNLYRHVKSTGLSRLAETPSFTMPPEHREAIVATVVEMHRAQSAMLEYQERQRRLEESSGGAYASAPSALSTLLGLPDIRGLASGALRAMEQRTGVVSATSPTNANNMARGGSRASLKSRPSAVGMSRTPGPPSLQPQRTHSMTAASTAVSLPPNPGARPEAAELPRLRYDDDDPRDGHPGDRRYWAGDEEHEDHRADVAHRDHRGVVMVEPSTAVSNVADDGASNLQKEPTSPTVPPRRAKTFSPVVSRSDIGGGAAESRRPPAAPASFHKAPSSRQTVRRRSDPLLPTASPGSPPLAAVLRTAVPSASTSPAAPRGGRPATRVDGSQMPALAYDDDDERNSNDVERRDPPRLPPRAADPPGSAAARRMQHARHHHRRTSSAGSDSHRQTTPVERPIDDVVDRHKQ